MVENQRLKYTKQEANRRVIVLTKHVQCEQRTQLYRGQIKMNFSPVGNIFDKEGHKIKTDYIIEYSLHVLHRISGNYFNNEKYNFLDHSEISNSLSRRYL